jgi:hypothetical protein
MTDAMQALHETSEMLKDVLDQINELVEENKALKKAAFQAAKGSLQAAKTRPWSGLTADEITEFAGALKKGNFIAGIQNIESKLRELNT